MDFTLFVGDFAYSSWSLRGWLLMDAFGIPFDLRRAHMRTRAFDAMLADVVPALLVPALSVSDGVRPPVAVWDTVAIAETLHEYHPQAGLWPIGSVARPTARSLVAEMHSGFGALRAACPMNMRRAYSGFVAPDAVRADLDRLGEIWAHARAHASVEGPYLYGAFSAVDAFFAPVASRIATYGLEMDGIDMAYAGALLAHGSVRRWRAMAMADGYVQPATEDGGGYELDLPARPNPHDPEIVGRVVTEGTAENGFCPFSGQDVSGDGLVEVDGRVIGFGDAFCRDKVAADPFAWPEVRQMLG